MTTNPLLRWQSVVLAMLSLSIGWGIRGNYGHEFGAMIPGALCAMAIALMSGREDWRQRVPFFAFFGACGWALGGSMAYMVTMSYAQSGQLATQLYGFLSVFAIGFLWASFGGAGTAYAALETRNRLTAFFRPFLWVLAVWTLGYFFLDDFVAWYQRMDGVFSDARQRNPFYWLDASWLEVGGALVAVCLFDLWDRRWAKMHWLAVFSAAGAVAGWAIERLILAIDAMPVVLAALVHVQGDVTTIDPATGQPFDPANLITNWPGVMFDAGWNLGWMLGLIAGIGFYFWRFGAFRDGAGLIARMGVWGYAAFLAGPVIGSNLVKEWGGIRMVPPRGDNWAFMLGALIGLVLYMRKQGLRPVADAALLSGLIGGVGFMAAEMVKILALVPGNPVLNPDPASIARWEHWRHANWHNILAEQGVGLIYGLAVLLPMALLMAKAPSYSWESRTRRWTEMFCVVFLLNVMLYVNIVKNVADWTQSKAVPASMKAPLAGFWEMPAVGWFSLVWVLITLFTVALLVAHTRHPLAVMPASWLGRGQMFYLALLWTIIVANFDKSVVRFHEQRLITEGLFFVNGLVAMSVLLVWPEPTVSTFEPENRWTFRRAILAGVAATVLGVFAFTGLTRLIYGDNFDGFGGKHYRFGPQADWRVKPLLKNQPHR